MDEIIESRVRVANFISTLNYASIWILEYFHDQGLRRGDIIAIITDSATAMLNYSDLDSNEPLFELLDYSINLLGPLTDNLEPFVRFQTNYATLYGYEPYFVSCWMYDGMYHFAHGLSATIASGQEYEIPSILNLYLKSVKFTG